MHKYHFFKATLDDLSRLTGPEADEYDLMKASGVLRMLFLDRIPVVDNVNRELRLPLNFRITTMEANDWDPALAHLRPETRFLAVDPPSEDAQQIVKAKRFLNHIIAEIKGHPYTVRNVIKCAAHVGGGVHFMPPDDEQEAALYEMATGFAFNDYNMLARSIGSIGRVSLEGLEPLLQATRVAP